MRHFLIDTLPGLGNRGQLSGPEAAHLRVLRPRVGTAITLVEPTGASASFILIDPDTGTVEQTSASQQPALHTPLHLVLAVIKGPAMDLAIRMATECGATHIHPTILQRSIARGDRADRWQRIAQSATKQCHRATTPHILPVASLKNIAPLLPQQRCIASPTSQDTAPQNVTGGSALFIGPEGGFTDAEIALALALGFVPINLGPHILRTPTAVAVGIARLRATSAE